MILAIAEITAAGGALGVLFFLTVDLAAAMSAGQLLVVAVFLVAPELAALDAAGVAVGVRAGVILAAAAVLRVAVMLGIAHALGVALFAELADEGVVLGGAVVFAAAVGADVDAGANGVARAIIARAVRGPDAHLAALGHAGRALGEAAGDDGEALIGFQLHERLQADAEGKAALLGAGNGERFLAAIEGDGRLQSRGEALKGGETLLVRAGRAAEQFHGLRAVASADERVAARAIFVIAGDEYIALPRGQGLRTDEDGRRAIRAANDGLGQRRAAQRQNERQTQTEQFLQFHNFPPPCSHAQRFSLFWCIYRRMEAGKVPIPFGRFCGKRREKPCPALAARGFKREGDGFCASFILFAA